MPVDPPTPPPPLKEWFDTSRYQSIATLTRQEAPNFEHDRFLDLCLEGLAERSLMQRVSQTAIAWHETLPGSFRQKVKVLRRLGPRVNHAFVAIALCEVISRYGRQERAVSLDALKDLTRYGSAEFAIRPFIIDAPEATLEVMQSWTSDPDEHVRRLASEGARPRLPWGTRLQCLIDDPSLAAPILDALRRDDSLYVRKSVANHLNDVAKDHPQWVIDRLASWDRTHPHTAWIAKHASRTLIKAGHPQALSLFGFGAKPLLTASLSIAPASLTLGEKMVLSAEVTSPAQAKAASLVIDYVLHYVRSQGRSSEKVFKWTEMTLQPGATVQLTKSQTIKDFSTRKHSPGRHRVELQINGHRVAESSFDLHLP